MLETLPILKNSKDVFFRYKMPILITKIKGNGNGIRTILTNIKAISSSLNRPPTYITKYFGFELGAQVTMNDEYIINGFHESEKLTKILYEFIDKFVLCTKCLNPETILSIIIKKIRLECIACGLKTIIPNTIHKVSKFIINHPPDNSKILSYQKINNDITCKKDNITVLCENNKTKTNSANLIIFSEFLKNNINFLLEVSFQKKLIKEAENLCIYEKSIFILAEIIFTEDMFEEIKKYRFLLIRFCYDNKKVQRNLLFFYEKFVGENVNLFKSAIKILKQFYDFDIIDEETIISWASKKSRKYVCKEISKKIHERVEPFIKWLREVEIEDEEDQLLENLQNKSSSSYLNCCDNEIDFNIDLI